MGTLQRDFVILLLWVSKVAVTWLGQHGLARSIPAVRLETCEYISLTIMKVIIS